MKVTIEGQFITVTTDIKLAPLQEFFPKQLDVVEKDKTVYSVKTDADNTDWSPYGLSVALANTEGFALIQWKTTKPVNAELFAKHEVDALVALQKYTPEINKMIEEREAIVTGVMNNVEVR